MTEPALEPVPVLQVCSPADLVELVPYLVGFHPTRSAVLVGLAGARDRVALTLRMDLDGLLSEPDLLARCVDHLRRARTDGVVLVVYDDVGRSARPLPRGTVVAEVASLLAQHQMRLTDALLVGDGRWWSYLCSDGDCCPADGHPLREPSAASPVAVAATVAGMTAAADRAALAAGLSPLPESDREPLRRAARRFERASSVEPHRALRRWRQALADQRRTDRRLTDEHAAELLVAMRSPTFRDRCCAWAVSPDAAAARAVVRQLARRASPPWDVTPYALVAWYAWRDGEGALSRVAIDHALASDPDCTFGLLIEELLDRGVDPRSWCDPPRRGRADSTDPTPAQP